MDTFAAWSKWRMVELVWLTPRPEADVVELLAGRFITAELNLAPGVRPRISNRF